MVIRAIENKAGKGERECQDERNIAILNRMVWESFTERKPLSRDLKERRYEASD